MTVVLRTCFFTMESTSFKSRFLTQINNSFGSGGMSLAFNETQFSSFIQFLKKQHQLKKAVKMIGMQDDNTWILGEDLQIDDNGTCIPESRRTHIWLNDMIEEGLGTITLKEVKPVIATPLDESMLNRYSLSSSKKGCMMLRDLL